jgi:hypothetical protein
LQHARETYDGPLPKYVESEFNFAPHDLVAPSFTAASLFDLRLREPLAVLLRQLRFGDRFSSDGDYPVDLDIGE